MTVNLTFNRALFFAPGRLTKLAGWAGWVGGVGVLFLAGCALTPPGLDAPRPEYFVAGKIVARPDDGPARAVSFEWRRTRAAAGPVDSVAFSRHGVAVARMVVSPEKVAVHTARGRTLTGEHLPAEHLGVAVPLRALGFWLAGRADPSASARETTLPGGTIRAIHQHGWEVVFEERDAEGRPTRIAAKFPGGRAEVELRPLELP